jgi:propionate CoA-transferase
MEFVPAISPNLREMDAAMFQENWGKLKSVIEEKNKKNIENVLVNR